MMKHKITYAEKQADGEWLIKYWVCNNDDEYHNALDVLWNDPKAIMLEQNEV